MIDNILFFVIPVLFLSGFIQIYKNRRFGCLLLCIPFFIAGVNASSNNDFPFEHLIFNGNADQLINAFVAGCMAISIPIFLMFAFGKDILLIIKHFKNDKSVKSNIHKFYTDKE